MPAFVNASNVRAYAGIDGINAPWSEANLGSNIRAASAFLEKRTGRQFEVQLNITKTFTTNGQAYLSIPDLQTLTSISRNGSALTQDTDVWLIPDAQQSGVAIGLFAAMFASMWALGERDWRSLIGVSLGTTATVYLLFIAFLQLRLPEARSNMSLSG